MSSEPYTSVAVLRDFEYVSLLVLYMSIKIAVDILVEKEDL